MLAIVIPYYKLTFFEATLWSLASQTSNRFKVYIGDDASPENPAALLEKYKGQFDFVYHRFGENLGGKSLTQQWERCISLSENEEWIMILGDDDVLGENVVEEFYKNQEEIKSVYNVVRFASIIIDSKGMEASSIYYSSKIEKSTTILFNYTRSSLSEYVFNKAKLTTTGFKDLPLAWFSDVLAILETSDFKDIFSINKAVIYVRISDESISGSINNINLKSKARFDFYYYLITHKIHCFSNIEKKELFLKINNCYLNDKKEYVLFLKISKMYLTKFLIKEYFSFLKLIFLNGSRLFLKTNKIIGIL